MIMPSIHIEWKAHEIEKLHSQSDKCKEYLKLYYGWGLGKDPVYLIDIFLLWVRYINLKIS